nr:MAG TPA: hypothetical protein [Caudoviricetes sp.]
MFKRQQLQFSRTVYYIGILHINAKNNCIYKLYYLYLQRMTKLVACYSAY